MQINTINIATPNLKSQKLKEYRKIIKSGTTFPSKADTAASASFLDLNETKPYPDDFLGLSWNITSAETTLAPSEMKNSLRCLALASYERFATNKLNAGTGLGFWGIAYFFFLGLA